MPNTSRSAFSILSNFILLKSPEGMMIPVAWTLCHEALFYALFAFTFYFSKRWYLVFLVWSAISLGYGYGESEFNLEIDDRLKFWFEYLLGSNNILFSLGMISARLTIIGGSRNDNGSVIMKRSHKAAAGIGLAIFISIYYHQNKIGLARDFSAGNLWLERLLYGLGFSAMIYGAGSIEESGKPTWSIGKELGDSSYSIYLFHLFVQEAMFFLIKSLNPSELNRNYVFLVFVASSILIGCAIHHSIEKPITKWLQRR